MGDVDTVETVHHFDRSTVRLAKVSGSPLPLDVLRGRQPLLIHCQLVSSSGWQAFGLPYCSSDDGTERLYCTIMETVLHSVLSEAEYRIQGDGVDLDPRWRCSLTLGGCQRPS